MRITLVSPRIAVQKGDLLGSGVPYWPLDLAIFAAFLRARDRQINVIDLFGMDPGRLSDHGDHYLQGRPLAELVETDAVQNADLFVLYALSYMSHAELVDMARRLKQARPGIPVLVLENSQAVTAYALPPMAAGFFDAGVDALVCGDAYPNWDAIEAWLEDRKRPLPDNLVTPEDPLRPVTRPVSKTVSQPVPAWDLFNLEGYWHLPYSHGPKVGRYLPILTSRGCPYPCDFCVIPETNARRWRPRPAAEVVDEMITLRDRFGVRHFQVEDVNPTVKASVWSEICDLLIQRRAGIFFYIVSGTKAETVRIEQVPRLAAAGCRYISISPESGSADVLHSIGKPFNYEHAIKLVAACRQHGIRTQACFLTGHPAETGASHRQSCDYLRRLVRAGLDEVAVFVVAAFAGSDIFNRRGVDMGNESALPSFSPKGRKDFEIYAQRRRELIRLFFIEKLRRGMDLWLQGLRALFGHPQTKMENLPRRALYLSWLVLRFRLRSVLWKGA
jgi:hypothetical protein